MTRVAFLYTGDTPRKLAQHISEFEKQLYLASTFTSVDRLREFRPDIVIGYGFFDSFLADFKAWNINRPPVIWLKGGSGDGNPVGAHVKNQDISPVKLCRLAKKLHKGE